MNRVFVTGASGYLGGAIAARLARAGNEVSGLTRTAAGAAALERVGVRPVVGDLTDRESYAGAIKNCDVTVHAAIATGPEHPAALDQQALEAVAHAAEDGRLRRFLYTSGFWVLGDAHGETLDDASPVQPLELVTWRAAHEEVVMDLLQREVTAIVFRPSIVYGGGRGILAEWFREAHEQHTITIPGDGSQIWGLVHRDDVAEAYALGLEHAQAGDRFLLGDGSTHTVGELADAVADATGATVKTWPREDVLATLGDYGAALLASARIVASKARRELGWVPRHTSFVSEARELYREWLAPREAQVS